MYSFINTFDDYVDDLISSDVDLLKELDFLLMQHLFNSIDLEVIKDFENIDDDLFVA